MDIGFHLVGVVCTKLEEMLLELVNLPSFPSPYSRVSNTLVRALQNESSRNALELSPLDCEEQITTAVDFCFTFVSLI